MRSPPSTATSTASCAPAPGLLAVYGVGADTAAILLVAAGDNAARLRSEAAWAHLCGVAPIPAGSRKTNKKRRLNSGGAGDGNRTRVLSLGS